MAIRCFIPPELWDKNPLTLSGPEARHLAKVLRIRTGEKVICLDGHGRQAEATVLNVTPQQILLHLGPRRSLPELPWTLTLAAALPGQGKMEEIVGQATQLGVRRIIPLMTERCIVRAPAQRLERKSERFRQVALEALKQSGAGWIPEVEPVTPLDRFFSRFSAFDLALIATVEGPHEKLSGLVRPTHRNLLLLVGPEGDFTPEEIQRAAQAVARRVGLGPSVLRCETACVALISRVQLLLGER